MVVAPDGGPRTIPPGPRARAQAILRAALLGLVPPLLLVGVTALIFAPELLGEQLFYGLDTRTFYYPLTVWASGEIQAGRLPLWLPHIFGGYPILADGEIGLLSPLQLLLLYALEAPFAYAWMRALHYLIAAFGLYLYARLLGANSLGAGVGALAFAYGSFMVGHLQHDNILRSAAWLPWLLLAAELALRSVGPARLAWVVAAALVLALAGLGVHIQPVLLGLLALGLVLLFGPFGRTAIAAGAGRPGVSRAAALGRMVYDLRAQIRGARRPGRAGDWLVSRALLGLAIVGPGLGLAAIQLIPLYQLALRSVRPTLATYAYATSFAVSPQQILTLVFPAMFNFDAERHWAFWAPHETTLYVGIAPLLLAVLALSFVRGKAVAFYGILAFVSLVLVFGDYLPIKPYTVVWSLPGFGYLRAPARFSLLLTLALAILAALGATWIARRARHLGRSRPLIGVLNGMLLLPIVLALAIGGLRWWLRFDPARATELFAATLQTTKENWLLGPWHVYYGLLEFTRPDNDRTAVALGLLAVVPLLLRLWLARPTLEAVWGGGLLLLTAADLWLFATSFYPRAYPEELFPAATAIFYLDDQPRPYRLLVEPALNQRFGANQLTGLGIETLNGYSSLEPPRYSDFWWSVVRQDNLLLDQFNGRYVLAARQRTDTRTFEGTIYHPHDRLMSGTAANPSGVETFRAPAAPISSVVLVAAIEGIGEVPAGTPVVTIVPIGPNGERSPVVVRGGVDIAEYLAGEPGLPMADYAGARVVWAGPSFTPPLTPPGDPVRLYGAVIPLPQPVEAVAIEVRLDAPRGRLHLAGLGLRAPDGSTRSVRAIDKAKYRPVAQDATSTLLENRAARPRVFVVGGAIGATELMTPDRLLALAWDPSRQVVVEGLPADQIHDATAAEAVGEARLAEYTPTRIVAQAELTAPGYLVLADRFDEGWQATVDGVEARVGRANGVSRVVAVPAGSHTVAFTYEPYALRLGTVVTGIALVVWAGLLVGALGLAIVRRVRRPARA